MLKAFLKTVLPATTRQALRRAAKRLRYRGTNHFCPTCGANLSMFLPWGAEVDFLCPVCGSKPPHRLATLAFDRHPEWFARPGVLLHVAPEVDVAKKLRGIAAARGLTYRGGGITGVGETYLNLLELPFQDGTVPFVYCCHVLNSLQDDRGAMREVHRVLHPQGVALLQVPAYWPGEHTVETNSLEERLRVFKDVGIHRCYTDADYVQRLCDAGFDVEHIRAAELPEEQRHRMELKGEVLHVCRKRASTS